MPKFKAQQVSTRAVINDIKVDCLPSTTFSGSAPIVPNGVDNLYPQRIKNAISKSPTASGCVDVLKKFVNGRGFNLGGDIVVNRLGETLNDVLSQCSRSYAEYCGFALHFNFNILGQITEITNVDLRYIRKNLDLDSVIFNDWEKSGVFHRNFEDLTIDLYNPYTSRKEVFEKASIMNSEDGKEDFSNYKGQVLYYTNDYKIYPTAKIDSASISASYEYEAQLYPYANMKNGFSGTSIVKYPSMLGGEETYEEGQQLSLDDDLYPKEIVDYDDSKDKQLSKFESDLETIKGAENAGGMLVVKVPVGVTGEFKDFKMVEPLAPTNIDKLFVNQNEKAENSIFKAFTMPPILLSVSQKGMFNKESYNDAYNYKLSDTEEDRNNVERVFNSFLPQSVFPIDNIAIIPPKIKQ